MLHLPININLIYYSIMMDNGCKICVVLVDPRDGKNVGAVCRAMKTMDLTDLRIVGGETIDVDQAARVAVHAGDVLDEASFFPNVRSAVKDCSIIAGVTRRRGKKRK